MDKDLNGQNQEREENLPETAENSAAESTREESPDNGGKNPKSRKPLEKKTLIRIISISAAAVVAAVALTVGLVLGLKGCEKGDLTVTLTASDHVVYNYTSADGEALSVPSAEVSVSYGQNFSFTLTVDDGYTQLPTVTAGTQKLNPSDGVYSFTVTENVTVTVTDVAEVSYALDGSGTESAPYSLKSVKDLNFLAEQINSGNTRYVQAYYELGNDVDYGGGKLTVIGDGSTVNSFFGGFFDGKGHTISNFVIETNGVDYVGLFGYVQASSNGGVLGTVQNVNLKDFTISSFAASGRNVTAGSLIGYGVASTLKNCSAVNGRINVFGNNFFCYVGGAVGIQQSAVVNNANGFYPFYSMVEGVHTDVDIFNGSGFTYAAGGITGMLYADYDAAPSTVTNCYSEGGVYGAMRAGGIVGFVNSHSSINNSYSTGEIAARSDMNNLRDEFGEEYGAYAGGIAGYCGYGTLISNSFSTAKTSADKQSDAAVALSGAIVGYAAEESHEGYGAVVYNCYSGNSAQGTSANFIKNTLKWNAAQWNAVDGSLPTLTGAEAEGTVEVKLDFGGKTVDTDGEKTFGFKIESGKYMPICEAYRSVEGLSETFVTTDGLTSYGLFFDDGLKNRVPYGFVPAGGVTLYAAFADYGEVAGSYYYNRNGRVVRLTLEDDGVYTYEDGVGYMSAYTYDGHNVLFTDGLFARLSEVVTDDGVSANFSARRFTATKTDGGLSLYDGVYFTADEPLEMTSTAPAVTGDAFTGTWEKSATINETYTFDGNGNWSYKNGAVTKSGIYVVNTNGAAVMKVGSADYGVAKIDASGLISLTLEGQTEATLYCLNGSMFGIWFDEESGNYVSFEGYGLSLTGDLVASIDGTPYALKYVRDNYCIDDSDGVCFTIMSDTSYFGYLIYIEKDKTLTGELFAQASDSFERHTFYLVDNYVGEWIGEDELDGVTFALVNFNGFGTYEVENSYGLLQELGYIEINGERVTYTVDVNDSLAGRFTYKNVNYTLSYDESGVVTIASANGGTATLGRKDGLYEYSFIDADNNVYSFNGGGNLSGGGILTVTAENGSAVAEYGYKMTGNLFPDKNIAVTLTDRTNGNEVGSMRVSGNKMLFALNGQRAESLDLNTPFTGVWAITGIWGNFSIGNFDLSLTARGGFRDMPNASYTLDIANDYATVTYMTSESLTSYTMYILYLEDGNLALSSQPYLIAGDYFYASRQDEVYGYWQNTEDSTRTLSFDGLADSKYTYGIAYDSGTRITYNYTRRFGKIYLWDITDDTAVSVLNTVDYQATGANVFTGTTRVAYELAEFDEVYTPVCTAKEGATEYQFYFDGSLVRDDRRGSYELIVMNGDVTRLVMHFAGEDDVTAEVNHKDGTVKIIG